MVPEFIVEKVVMSTLLLDKGTKFGSFQDRFQKLQESVLAYLEQTTDGFVSNHTAQFKDFLEQRVGTVFFTKQFAVRARGGSYRLFMNGKEIFPK